jgi:hypothetical protein
MSLIGMGFGPGGVGGKEKTARVSAYIIHIRVFCGCFQADLVHPLRWELRSEKDAHRLGAAALHTRKEANSYASDGTSCAK